MWESNQQRRLPVRSRTLAVVAGDHEDDSAGAGSAVKNTANGRFVGLKVQRRVPEASAEEDTLLARRR